MDSAFAHVGHGCTEPARSPRTFQIVAKLVPAADINAQSITVGGEIQMRPTSMLEYARCCNINAGATMW